MRQTRAWAVREVAWCSPGLGFPIHNLGLMITIQERASRSLNEKMSVSTNYPAYDTGRFMVCMALNNALIMLTVLKVFCD